VSKITNDELTQSGTGCFIAVPVYGNSGRQRVIVCTLSCGDCTATVKLCLLCWTVSRSLVRRWLWSQWQRCGIL